MSTQPTAAPATKPMAFIGLKAYTEKQADIFFGRNDEIKSLYRLIKANTLTIVFGKSGTGKTSLLNAGVFPKLREDYCLPFRIRLEFLDDSPPLVMQIKKVLRAEIDKYGFKVNNYPGDETLWEYFHREPLWQMVTPILIFDQFEEIFTLAAKSQRFKKEEMDKLIEELSDLVENSIPEKIKDQFINNGHIDYHYQKQKVKIIFSFREDFLPEMESLTPTIPSVKYSRFRLLPMNGHQAYEVITKTWKTAIEPSEANKIVYFLTNETETDNIDIENRLGKFDLIEIEPSLLSQVCLQLEKVRIQEGQQKISAEFLKKNSKGLILRSIYNQSLAECNFTAQQEGNTVPVNALKEFIEDNLITDEGYRTRFSNDMINEDIKAGIDCLKQKYLIREEGNYIELTHDVIVTLVKSDREERRKQLALLAARKKARRKMRWIIAMASLAVIVVWYLFAYKAYEKKVALEKDQQDLIAQNKILSDSIKASLRILNAIDKKNGNKPLNKKGPAPMVGSADSLLQKIYNDSIIIAGLLNDQQLFNNRYNILANHLRLYQDSLENIRKFGEPQTQKLKSDYEHLLAGEKYRKDFFRMYETHINRIIGFANDSANLQYHIRLLKQHREGFNKRLDFPE